ncbi:hypothetical protein Tco_0117316 [Tanacetum coccineum]
MERVFIHPIWLAMILFVFLTAVTPTNKDKRVRFAEPEVKTVLLVLTIQKPSGNIKRKIGSPVTPRSKLERKESRRRPPLEIKAIVRRPKQLKSVGSSKKAKIVESKISNNSEPTHLWGSNATDVPSSSSLVNDTLSRSSSGSRDTNLYTVSLDDMLKTSPICFLSRALERLTKKRTKNKAKTTKPDSEWKRL